MPGDSLSRRRFLVRGLETGGGVAALALSGYVGYWLRGSPPDTLGAAPLKKTLSTTTRGVGASTTPYVSRPDLRPPTVTLTHEAGSTKPLVKEGSYFILTPKSYVPDGPGQSGLMIVSGAGDLVWFRPTTDAAMTLTDMQVQVYRGKPVLTWWEGSVPNGVGQGTGYIADATYRVIATVQAGGGLKSDAHELNLTPQGTALITAYARRRTDLTAVGGPKDGVVYTCQAQEIDVATGTMVHAWDSLEHVGVEESEAAFVGGTEATPYDYFHINSVALAEDGDLLISSRNTWTTYKVSRDSGEIVWRLGGRKSDFEMGPGAQFYWQHHVRAHAGGRLSIFDDGASPAEEPQSRGLVLQLDVSAKRCDLVRAYTHPAKLQAANQGSIQVLDNGRVVVGWGNQPYFSEFDDDGTLLMDGRYPADDQTYRAFRSAWSGQPAAKPDVVVESYTTSHTVYVSWNGDTETAYWRVLAGQDPASLRTVAMVARTGFETVIAVQARGTHYAVQALDQHGTRLAQSATVTL